MQLSETIKLYPDRYQKELIVKAMDEYINTVNSLVLDASNGIVVSSTADVKCNLPSAVINQCIRDAKSIIKKHYKNCISAVNKYRKHGIITKASKLPVLRKPCYYVNNQNYKVRDNGNIEFPVIIDGKCKRIAVRSLMTERQHKLLSGSKFGTARIVCKNKKLCIQIVYEAADVVASPDGNTMGVDLGIKCPAVSYTNTGKVKFYGNGRKNKHMRRHYAALRHKLQKAKKQKAVKRINDKEQRIMRDIDHKLSRNIINTAIANNVSVIKLERLQNIRSTTRKRRKNNHSLHTWSFYRLAQFIEYKAKQAGITVEYVNPAYTSQTCPVCGSVHHADDRNYLCECGYHIHRDVLGALNICNSTKFVGKRRTA